MGFLINPYLVQPSGPSYDSDAQAFFTAAGITDNTQKSAVNQLVLDLKSYSIWTKMKALYPFVGGTATTHKYNLKDPQDTDAAFRLVFNGGWTHSSTGALPNNSNTFADTKLIPSTSIFSSNQNIHCSFYSRTNDTDYGYEVGASYNGNGNSFGLITKYGAFNAAYAFYGAFLSASNSNSQGHYISNSTSAGVKIIKNASVLATGGTASTDLTAFSTYSVYLCADNRTGTAAEYSTKECAFASIGDGLTDTEAANFYTAVQTFQTTLSRNV